MPPKVFVPVDIVHCVVPIIAEPGDRLMILNGICVGVDTSSEASPSPVEEPLIPLLNPPKKKTRRGFRSSSKFVQDAKHLLEIITNNGPIAFGSIMQISGLSKGQTKSTIESLDRRGLLEPSPKLGSGNSRLYQAKSQTNRKAS